MPSAFIHVVHCGEHDERARGQPKQTGKDVGMKAVAVDQVGLKLADERAPSFETNEHTALAICAH